MQPKKNGLNDSDKILITVALWICSIALFVATLSLPMLPERVTIFATPDNADAQYYSKYYNLALILTAIVPAAIVLISAVIKKRNRLQNNFLSITFFCIMLALCMNSVIVYGILKQFDASKAVKLINFHALSVVIVAFLLSLLCALFPKILRGAYAYRPQQNKTVKTRLAENLCRYWNVGAYGFLVCAIVGSFIPSAYGYIVLAASIVIIMIFMLCMKGFEALPSESAPGPEPDKGK